MADAAKIILVGNSAILIRADGTRLYPKGGPDNNPLTRIAHSLSASVTALEAVSAIENPRVRAAAEESLIQAINLQADHILASAHPEPR